MAGMKLIAARSFKYGTRRLEAGDPFEATTRDGKVLIGIRKATLDTGATAAPAMAPMTPPAPAPKTTGSVPPSMSDLRIQARAAGIPITVTWSRERILAALKDRAGGQG